MELNVAKLTIRTHKARKALHKFLWEAMYEDEPNPCPYPPLMTDEWILSDLHKILGIRKRRWWQIWR